MEVETAMDEAMMRVSLPDNDNDAKEKVKEVALKSVAAPPIGTISTKEGVEEEEEEEVNFGALRNESIHVETKDVVKDRPANDHALKKKSSSNVNMPWLSDGPAKLRFVTPLIPRLLDFMGTPDAAAAIARGGCTLGDASTCVLFLLEVDQYLKETNEADIEASARRLLRKYFSEDCETLHLSPWLRASGNDAVVGAVHVLASAQNPERVQNVKEDAEMIRTSIVWIAEYIETLLAKFAYPHFFYSPHCPRNINVHRKPREDASSCASATIPTRAARIAVAFCGEKILCAASDLPSDEQRKLARMLSKYLVPDGRYESAEPPPEPYSFPFVTAGGTYGGCAVWYERADDSGKLKSKPAFVACGVGVLTQLTFPLFHIIQKTMADVYSAVTENNKKKNDSSWASEAFLRSTVFDPLNRDAAKAAAMTKSPPGLGTASEILRIMSLDHILTLFCCLIMEHKVLLVSSSYTTLTLVAETFKALLAPLEWCHVYVPVLPRKMLDHLQCPTPFLIGIHSSYAYKQDFPFAIDLTVIDLDSDSVTLPPPRMSGDGEARNSARRISKLPPSMSLAVRKPLFDALYPFSAHADSLDPSKAASADVYAVFRRLVMALLQGCDQSSFLLHLGGGIARVLDSDCFFRTQIEKLGLRSGDATLHAALLRELARTQAFSHHLSSLR